MENSWITAQEFQAGLQSAGSTASPDQIERWRRNGLLPRPRQIGLGRGRGSLIKVPAISIAQTLEVEALFAIRRKLDWVGWQLWLKGYAVSDGYWLGPLETAQSSILEVRAASRQFDLTQLGMDATAEGIKQLIMGALRGTALDGQLARIPAELVETLAGFLQEIIAGHFHGFSPDINSRPNADERDAVLSSMGVNSKSAQQIADYAGSIEFELEQISKAFDAIAARRTIAEPSIQARREFRSAIDIAIILHRNSKAITGGTALKTFKRIAANPAISVQAIMLLAWAEYRKISKTILSFSEIMGMHGQVSELPEKSDR